MTLFAKLIRKHDYVWSQRARWPLHVRIEVCKRLQRAIIREAAEK